MTFSRVKVLGSSILGVFAVAVLLAWDRTRAATFWMLVVLLLVGFAYAIRSMIAWQRAIKELRAYDAELRSLCPDCGYDLRATPGRCPECGRVVQTGASATSDEAS